MRLRSISIILASALVGAAGCDSGTSPSDAAALSRAEARWSAAGPSSYQVETRHLCFCTENQWSRITVRNDTLITVVDEQGDTIAPQVWGRRMPIDSSFAFIRELLESRWDNVDLEFDETSGFPRQALFELGGDIADGSAGVAYQNLIPLVEE